MPENIFPGRDIWENEVQRIQKKLEYDKEQLRAKKGNLKEEFCAFLEKQIMMERNIEGAKIELVTQPDFNNLSAFRLFDVQKKGSIKLEEFMEGLRKLGVVGLSSDISYLFGRYDKERLERLRYSDFCTLIEPVDAAYRAIVRNRLVSDLKKYNDTHSLSKHTIDLIKHFFETVINLEKDNKLLAQSLLTYL